MQYRLARLVVVELSTKEIVFSASQVPADITKISLALENIYSVSKQKPVCIFSPTVLLLPM